MVNFKEDEQLKTLNHSCAHLDGTGYQASVPTGKVLGRTGSCRRISTTM